MNKYADIMGLSGSFGINDLKKARRNLARKFHPDFAKNDTQRAEFNEKMKQINNAYDVLYEYLQANGTYTRTKTSSSSSSSKKSSGSSTKSSSSSKKSSGSSSKSSTNSKSKSSSSSTNSKNTSSSNSKSSSKSSFNNDNEYSSQFSYTSKEGSSSQSSSSAQQEGSRAKKSSFMDSSLYKDKRSDNSFFKKAAIWAVVAIILFNWMGGGSKSTPKAVASEPEAQIQYDNDVSEEEDFDDADDETYEDTSSYADDADTQYEEENLSYVVKVPVHNAPEKKAASAKQTEPKDKPIKGSAYIPAVPKYEQTPIVPKPQEDIRTLYYSREALIQDTDLGVNTPYSVVHEKGAYRYGREFVSPKIYEEWGRTYDKPQNDSMQFNVYVDLWGQLRYVQITQKPKTRQMADAIISSIKYSAPYKDLFYVRLGGDVKLTYQAVVKDGSLDLQVIDAVNIIW